MKIITPLKFNSSGPEKWWLEDYFPIVNANFLSAMLNFGGGKIITSPS